MKTWMLVARIALAIVRSLFRRAPEPPPIPLDAGELNVVGLGLHGIGKQKRGCTEPARVAVGLSCSRWIESFWSDITAAAIDRASRGRNGEPLRSVLWSIGRWFFATTLGSAILYGRREIGDAIRARVRDAIMAVPLNAELVIFAHSLGTVIAADVLEEMQRDRLVMGRDFARVRAIVFVGSPLRLFAAGLLTHNAAALPEGVPVVNCHCPFDMVGWPLADWYSTAIDVCVINWRLHLLGGYVRNPRVVAWLRWACRHPNPRLEVAR